LSIFDFFFQRSFFLSTKQANNTTSSKTTSKQVSKSQKSTSKRHIHFHTFGTDSILK